MKQQHDPCTIVCSAGPFQSVFTGLTFAAFFFRRSPSQSREFLFVVVDFLFKNFFAMAARGWNLAGRRGGAAHLTGRRGLAVGIWAIMS
ncbi:hypothetical protein AAMO2058_000435500 [Amorphochlora amoebiformis]